MATVSRTVRARVKPRRPKGSVSDTAFKVQYLRRSREIWRRYLESKPWISQIYSSILNIKPKQQIVDVGCGPGDFTRFLAKLSAGKARILGIDSNQKSVTAALRDTQKAGLSRVISYKLGDVNHIPLGDGYADLVCCRTLLMHLRDPVAAVKEMVRITKPGGSVVAVEGGKMHGFHDATDEEFSRVAMKASDAWVEGIRKLEGKEFRIGEKLPGIFQKAGLTNIKAEIQADAWLYTDPRRKLRDVKDELRFDYAMFKESRKRDRKYLLAGGMSNSKITDFYNRYESRSKGLLSDDRKLRNDASVYGASLFIVSGTKR